MTTVMVKDEIAVAPAVLWELVEDFGNVKWMPGMTGAEIRGSGPGMLRIFGNPDGSQVHERLDAVDEASRSVRYSIPQGLPFPVSSYDATMQVFDAGGGKSRLEWSCVCEPDGATEEEVVQAISGAYNMLIGWIREYLTK